MLLFGKERLLWLLQGKQSLCFPLQQLERDNCRQRALVWQQPDQMFQLLMH